MPVPTQREPRAVRVVRVTEAMLRDESDTLAGVEFEGGPRQLGLDLGAVRFITARGLGRLLALHARLRAAGGRLTLFNVAGPVYEVFAVTHLTQVFDVRPRPGVVPQVA